MNSWCCSNITFQTRFRLYCDFQVVYYGIVNREPPDQSTWGCAATTKIKSSEMTYCYSSYTADSVQGRTCHAHCPVAFLYMHIGERMDRRIRYGKCQHSQQVGQSRTSGVFALIRRFKVYWNSTKKSCRGSRWRQERELPSFHTVPSLC